MSNKLVYNTLHGLIIEVFATRTGGIRVHHVELGAGLHAEITLLAEDYKDKAVFIRYNERNAEPDQVYSDGEAWYCIT